MNANELDPEQYIKWLSIEETEERGFEQLLRTATFRNNDSCTIIPWKRLQKQGVAILRLNVSECRAGLVGHIIIDLDQVMQYIPSCQLREGDNVFIMNANTKLSDTDESDSNSMTGTIQRVSDTRITVICKSNGHDYRPQHNTQVNVIKLGNTVSIKRIKTAVSRLGDKSTKDDPFISSLVRANEHDSSWLASTNNIFKDTKLKFFNEMLNESQKQAVEYAIKCDKLCVIHGPPGTGKTVTLVEIVNQLLHMNKKRFLLCGPSNMSVDNFARQLLSCKDPRMHQFCRIGHPARIHPELQSKTLEELFCRSNQGQVLQCMREDLDRLLNTKTTTATDRRTKYSEIKLLRKELKQRESTAIKSFLSTIPIILATCTGSGSKLLEPVSDSKVNMQSFMFDVVVIDEAAQALEGECWISTLKLDTKNGKLILAGDHLQLSPTIQSDDKDVRQGLGRTMLDRLVTRNGELAQYSKFLSIQYRMHQAICTWASSRVYNNTLKTDPSANITLCDLNHVEKNILTSHPIVLIDTMGELSECKDDDEHESSPSSVGYWISKERESKYNLGEVDLVLKYVNALLDSGIDQSWIAVIAPYSAQVIHIKQGLSMFDHIEIDTVDGFQGREKHVVILSLVRSNDFGDIGFLSDSRRINVALTRAKHHLCIIMDTETLSKHPFYQLLIDYCSESDYAFTITHDLVCEIESFI